MNLIYKHNSDGSINTAFEIKKIYVMVILALSSLYYFNLNLAFNNDLNTLLNSMNLSIYFILFLFAGIGVVVFRVANKFEKIRTRKKDYRV